MKNILIFILILVLAAAMGIGLARYAGLDKALRIFVIYLAAQLASEVGIFLLAEYNEYDIRTLVINIYCIIEVGLITQFFLCALKPKNSGRNTIINISVWTVIGIVNMLFLKSVFEFNNNFLLLEGFCIITMSLYYIYWLLKNDIVRNVFIYPHFWVAIALLTIWSMTLFFWGFIITLYGAQWEYANMAMSLQVTLNIIIYSGIGVVLLLYPKYLAKSGRREMGKQ